MKIDDAFDIFKGEKMMTIYKNDPKYKNLITSKNRHLLMVGNVKISNDKKNTKSRILEFLIKSIQSGVKSVYDKGYRDNLHHFQCHTM